MASALLRSDGFCGGGHRQQIGVAEDAGQQVVEVVRHAAGEHAEAFELLLLEDAAIQHAALVLGLAPRRDVAHQHEPSGKPILAVAHRLHFDFHRAAVDADHVRADRASASPSVVACVHHGTTSSMARPIDVLRAAGQTARRPD